MCYVGVNANGGNVYLGLSRRVIVSLPVKTQLDIEMSCCLRKNLT